MNFFGVLTLGPRGNTIAINLGFQIDQTALEIFVNHQPPRHSLPLPVSVPSVDPLE